MMVSDLIAQSSSAHEPWLLVSWEAHNVPPLFFLGILRVSAK